ncbi:MAG: hypothetical protein HYZ47_01205, partial [Simkania negevensis]|nr:hypothetical protein [Simkania negevensis]
MKLNAKNLSKLIASKQKKFYLLLLFTVIAITAVFIFSTASNEKTQQDNTSTKNTFDVVSKNVKGETIRLSQLENVSD